MIQIATAAAFWMMAAAALTMGWKLNRGIERALIVSIAVAILASGYLQTLLEGKFATLGVAMVDLCLAVTACAVALNARTYWPMWFAALSLLAPATALVGWVTGSEHWMIATLAAFWAVPALIVVLTGSLLDAHRGPLMAKGLR